MGALIIQGTWQHEYLATASRASSDKESKDRARADDVKDKVATKQDAAADAVEDMKE
jgi:hypothetical protein